MTLTFLIAYGLSGGLIVAGRSGYEVHNVVTTVPELLANVPFALYILSPAIASYVVLRANRRVSGLREWLRLVFAVRGRPAGFLLALSALALYFALHLLVSGPSAHALPWFMFFLSLPGNLVIGGMEEAGWMTALQPGLDRRWGFVPSSLVVGIIWLLWHVPLFFIPGTNHESGQIDFWMFAVQVMAFRFLYGAIFRFDPLSAARPRWRRTSDCVGESVQESVSAVDNESSLQVLSGPLPPVCAVCRVELVEGLARQGVDPPLVKGIRGQAP